MATNEMLIGHHLDDNTIVQLPSDVLVKNSAILGSVGSGKTVAAKVVIEESASVGIPSVIIDPHGDIAKMALPQSPKELKSNGIDPKDADAYFEKVEFRIWTPASDVGLRLCLNPFASAPEVEDHSNMSDKDPKIIEALDAMASGFTSVSGFSTSRKSGSVKAFLNQLLFHSMQAGELPGSFQQLSQMVLGASEYLSKWGHDDNLEELTDGLLSERDRVELSRGLRALSTGLSRMLFEDGVPLNIETMVTPIEEGKTPVNIILLDSLQDDQARQAFVAELCRNLFTWARNSPRRTSKSNPRLLCLIDEVHQFLPPHPKNPAAKSPLLSLYKEGRKYGLGCLLATQQMTDVDYKALGNVNTGFFGRITDPRERNAVKPQFSHTIDPDGHLDFLATCKAGEFTMLSRDTHASPIPVKFRWLYGKHGNSITEDEVKIAMSNGQRRWADKLSQSVEFKIEKFRKGETSERSEQSTKNVLEEDAVSQLENVDEPAITTETSALSGIESRDSVFTGNIEQKTVQGPEKVEFYFNLGKEDDIVPEDVEEKIKTSFLLHDVVVRKGPRVLEDKIKSTSEEFFSRIKFNESTEIDLEIDPAKFTLTDRIVVFVCFYLLPIMAWVACILGLLYPYFPTPIQKSLITVWCLDQSQPCSVNWETHQGIGIDYFLSFSVDPLIVTLLLLPWILFLIGMYYSNFRNDKMIRHRMASLQERIDVLRDSVADQVKNFEITNKFKNFYIQTCEAEYCIVSLVKRGDFENIICIRRKLVGSDSREGETWINNLGNENLVSISVNEAILVMGGIEPNFNESDWAKRRVIL